MPSRSILCMRAALVLLAPIAVFGANGTVIVLCVMALGAPSLAAARSVLSKWSNGFLGAALIGLVLYMCLSASYAIVPADSAEKALRLFALLIISVLALSNAEVLNGESARRLAKDFALAALAIVLLAGLEYATNGLMLRQVKDYAAEHLARGLDYPLNDYVTWRVRNAIGRAAIVLLAIGPFALLEIGRRSRVLAILALVLGGAVIMVLPIATAKIAALAAIFVAAATYAAPRFIIIGAAAAALVGMIAFPWAMLMIDPAHPLGFSAEPLGLSMQHRLYIWNFAAERITDRPWFGWGLEASRAIPGADREVTLYLNGQPFMRHPVVLDLHPHNAVLHVWLEGGVFGALLFSGVVLGIAQRILALSADRALQCAAMASAIGLAVCAGSSFGLWQDWWLSTMVMAALAASVFQKANAETKT